MIVYRDILTGDEVLSDAFKLDEVVDEEGNVIPGLMSTESKNIVKSDGDIDVGCGNAFGSGGEEEGGGADNTVATVNNVIDGFQYTETQIGTAADFKTWIKEYVGLIVKARKDKALEKDLPQVIEKNKEFREKSATPIAKFFLKRFSDLQFYLGPSFDSRTAVFSLYKEGATTPTFYYIMYGLDAEKF